MKDTKEPEICLRCGTPMEWRHSTWQCTTCRFKLGCCEGEPQGSDPPGQTRFSLGVAASTYQDLCQTQRV